MAELEAGGVSGLVDLAGDYTTDISHSEQHANASCAFAVWCTVSREPSDVCPRAEKTGCGYEVCGKIFDSSWDVAQ